ncbi:DUF484 family protein [Methylotuvimicrobium alcaliphilum]|uniref:Phytochrome sensor protein n=1 Tax=Methylotuvimicrobium alcaliphilum (strain DSM 19304 / NCIMB 14124 / VKM B-2133 / 20Z) TaxID=1091494 RepID=G4SVF1_META2|nr:DUF484 family protein [Methylotuvimicrobium alcaliphilum]CCE22923.1 conserved protein of unknown function [Methylotuvimicrobium alcaliphilum 20Z]
MKKQALNTLTDKQVEAYLQANPEFFNDHLNLLESMTIPHPSGDAISLISKQLEIFRVKHQELENQLTALIEIARDNDTSFNRMHKLTLALLDAATLDEAVANLEHVFVDFFMTDFVAVRIISEHEQTPIANLFIAPNDPNLQHFASILNSSQPKCGRPTLAQARVLFGDEAAEVKSCAIIPMSFTQLEGIVAIGSREDNRFHYSMGNLFLTQMSEIIATRLISLLHQSEHD